MQFAVGDILHIYNRGNNKQQIFFDEDNYQFFLGKIKYYVCPVSDVLAYCLMPNHFHLLVQVNENSIKQKRMGSLTSSELPNAVRVVQSSYALAINKNKKLTGSLFQQKAKFKILSPSINPRNDYLQCCFHYIHQNPVRAGLVKKMEDWRYSSFNEYANNEAGGLCNRTIADELLHIPSNIFYDLSYSMVDENLLLKIKSL